MRILKNSFLLLAILCLVASSHAQGRLRATATAGSVNLQWVASMTPGTNVLIQRASCNSVTVTATEADGSTVGTCSAPGTFSPLATVTSGTVTFSDTSVSAGTGYAYQMASTCNSASCPAGISGTSAYVPTPALGVKMASQIPAPPTSPSLTASATVSGTSMTVSAQWTDAPNLPTVYALLGPTTSLTSGTATNGTGSYSRKWTKTAQPAIMIVCDYNGACASKQVN
jgi:hypothetical protein